MSSPQEIIAQQQTKIDRLTKQNGQLLDKVRKQVKQIEELRVANRELRKYLDTNFEKDANAPKISTKESKGFAPVETKVPPTAKGAKKVAPAVAKKPASPIGKKPVPAPKKTPQKVAENANSNVVLGSSSSDGDDTGPKPHSMTLNPGAGPIPGMITPQHFDLMKEIRAKMLKRKEEAASNSPTSASSGGAGTAVTPGSPKLNQYPNMPKPPPPVGKPVMTDANEEGGTKAEEKVPVVDMRKRTLLGSANKESTNEAPVEEKKSTQAPSQKAKPLLPAKKSAPSEPVKPDNEVAESSSAPSLDVPATQIDQKATPAPATKKPATPKKGAPPPLPSRQDVQIDRSALFAEIRKGSGLKRVERAVSGNTPSPKAAGGVNPVLAQLQRRGKAQPKNLSPTDQE
mmetsp:Transcript_1698/g.5960  ORF Transcript_1698/g.5960 Transcript_1698/m.5960 type:complete len:400 (-) Transcript_1698:104-1303(-)|eukprot:CAMPEP_0117446710 /NCGR_PEP_ID=MMETSP0759-20121206/6489_1 /TAXON_ID=63605 /ORGANISM="Percolomonas cosmopolitus, Strain WS" /LENGTH=399 /DNA_ID=CAMNT_0005239001 /DNA_START=198 /DNA_END=1397 /DNA_ORIENTATION=-